METSFGRRTPVLKLRDAFIEVLEARGGNLMVAATLIDGVNDRPEDAAALARLLSPLVLLL